MSEPLDPSFASRQGAGLPHEVDLQKEIARRVPDLAEAVSVAAMGQVVLATQVLASSKIDLAVRIVVNQGVNDFLDLLAACQGGLGRSALRTSRVLVEHAANVRTVMDEPGQSQRYQSHLHHGHVLFAELAPGSDLLPKAERSAYLHRLGKLRKASEGPLAQAMKDYGPAFRRGWTQRNLHDRCVDYDLDDLYRYYRLASLVIHGSAGGSLGALQADGRFGPVFRIGQSVAMAPVALWGGIRAYLALLESLEHEPVNLNVAEYVHAVTEVALLWPEYHRACTSIDQRLWPTTQVRGTSAVMVLTRNGKRRWYLHVPALESLIPAIAEPELDETTLQTLNDLSADLVKNHQHEFDPQTGTISVEVANAAVSPDPSGRSIPATALMLPNSAGGTVEWKSTTRGPVT